MVLVLHLNLNAGGKRHLGRNEFEPSSAQLLERGLYNPHVAGPPAALALGLIYFGSNNARVACPLLPGVDFVRFLSVARSTSTSTSTSASAGACASTYASGGAEQQTMQASAASDPLPVNVAELERVPPELFVFRALAHALIYWHAIEPTRDWVHAHFPRV